MAHFIGRIQTDGKPEVTRLGSKNGHVKVTANGWTGGVQVYAHHNKETGKDVFEVWETSGSNGSTERMITKVEFDA